MSYLKIIEELEAKRPPAWDLLNLGLISIDPERNRVVMEWQAQERHCHSVKGHPKGGIVQGGIVTGWLDAAMASACLFDGDPLMAVASLEIKVAFLLPAHPGLYRSYGTVIRRGRSIAFTEAELRDSCDSLIARGSSTAAVRSSDRGSQAGA
jgi:acyl-CoA thioesterase